MTNELTAEDIERYRVTGMYPFGMSAAAFREKIAALASPSDGEIMNEMDGMGRWLPTEAAPVEQAAELVPAFLRKRLERAIQEALHPVGMSPHDGQGRFHATDIQYLLQVIDTLAASASPGDEKEGEDIFTSEMERAGCRALDHDPDNIPAAYRAMRAARSSAKGERK